MYVYISIPCEIMYITRMRVTWKDQRRVGVQPSGNLANSWLWVTRGVGAWTWFPRRINKHLYLSVISPVPKLAILIHSTIFIGEKRFVIRLCINNLSLIKLTNWMAWLYIKMEYENESRIELTRLHEWCVSWDMCDLREQCPRRLRHLNIFFPQRLAQFVEVMKPLESKDDIPSCGIWEFIGCPSLLPV